MQRVWCTGKGRAGADRESRGGGPGRGWQEVGLSEGTLCSDACGQTGLQVPGTGFCLSGCPTVTDAVSGCTIRRDRVSAREKSSCHLHSSVMEEEELQNQLPTGFLAWLRHVCLLFTFWSEPFTCVFLLWEEGWDDETLRGPLWPSGAV